MNIKYLVLDYSNCKKGDGFKTDQIIYLKIYDTKEDALEYAKGLNKKDIGIEVWSVDEDGMMKEFIEEVEV